MVVVGGKLVKYYCDLVFMGFLEVVKNICMIFRNICFCKEDVVVFEFDVLIFVDYFGFNLRIVKWVKKVGIKVFYYISF